MRGALTLDASKAVVSRYRMRMSDVSGEISLMTALLRAGVVNEVITWDRYVRRGVPPYVRTLTRLKDISPEYALRTLT